MADGGNVALHEIDGNVVRLKLQGACGACPSSVMTMRMGIQRRLMDEIPEIAAVEATTDKEAGLKLNEENVEKVLLLVMVPWRIIKILIVETTCNSMQCKTYTGYLSSINLSHT